MNEQDRKECQKWIEANYIPGKENERYTHWVWQAACEYKDEQLAMKRPGGPADTSYPNAEDVAKTLRNCQEDLITEANFVLWQDKQLAAKDALIEKLQSAIRWGFDAAIEGDDSDMINAVQKLLEVARLHNDDTALREYRKKVLLEAADYFYNTEWVRLSSCGQEHIGKVGIVEILRRMAEE